MRIQEFQKLPKAKSIPFFNEDTVDKVLDYLMQNGQKIESGDKLGKSHHFCKKSPTCHFIEERFNKIIQNTVVNF